MTELHIAPNRPITLALIDPEGRFRVETGMGQYQTTTGELVTLPRPAVILLNTLDPQPGEQIVICKHWSGRPGEKAEWTISLSPKSENARAEAEKAPSDLTGQLERSIEAVQARKAAVELPTPIRRPARSRSTPEVQPRLFDRGTGNTRPRASRYPAIDRFAGRGHRTPTPARPVPGERGHACSSGIYSVHPNTANRATRRARIWPAQ